MSRSLRTVCLLPLAAAMACTDVAAPTIVDQGVAVEGRTMAARECYPVSFALAVTPTSTFTATGVVTGDLQGTTATQFDPTSLGFFGATIKNAGMVHWEIDGGIVPGLESFVTTFTNKNINMDRPGSPATTFENVGKHRAYSGVSKANLTYTGVFDATVSAGVLNFRGVICP